MELWIRSQDKEKLLKISGIQYQNCKLVENETVEANILIGFYSSYENEILGEYKTKERALEVLDEIQNFICIEIHENNINYEKADLILKGKIVDSLCKVYQMPEK